MSVLLVLLMFSQADSLDIVRYGAHGRIIYIPNEDRVILIDSAWVKYKDLQVNSDSIEYNTETRILSALKQTYLFSSSENITGDVLYYNIDSKKGMMVSGETKIEMGDFTGKEIWMVSGNTLNVNRGYYTTCDHEPPHYYFYAPRMKILLNDMAITQPVVLYVQGMPVVAAPFWFFPISKNRKSGLLPFKAGQSKTEGRYAKGISYYWVINDYADMTFALDVMEKKGFMPKLEAVYIIQPYVRGTFLGTYIRETDTRRQRWSFNMNHQSLLPLGATLDARADFQSDRSYDPDYTEDRIVWLKKEAYSFASLTRPFSIGVVNLSFEQRRDYDNRTTEERLPLATFSLISRALFPAAVDPRWFNRIYWSGSISGLNFHSVRFDTVTNQDSVIWQRSIGGRTGLSSNQKILGSINLTEGIGYSHTSYFSDTTPSRISYDFNAGANLNLYRVYGLYLFGIQGLLHQLTPSIGYSFSPDVEMKGFFGIPRFSTVGQANKINFGLGNLFQGKVGKLKEKKDIVVINAGSGYDLLNRKKPISPISLSLDFPSLTKIKTRIGMSYNIYDQKFSYNIVSSADLSNLVGIPAGDSLGSDRKGLTLRVYHYYTRDGSNMLNYQVGLNVTRNWALSFNGGYDIKTKKTIDYNISVTRDLHCWQGIFTASGLGAEWKYDFKVQIKEIPEIQIGKGLFGWAP